MKPILFNTEMVRAILANRKSVTRRVVKQSVVDKMVGSQDGRILGSFNACHPEWGVYPTVDDAPYQPGDILYVRETWQHLYMPDRVYIYKADSDGREDLATNWKGEWRPSIHMPKKAARIFLRVTDVRVERLQDITELDILEKEGVTVYFPQPKPSYMSLAYVETRLKPAVRKAFADLWDSTLKKADRALYGWAANPYVWVIGFERISKEDIPPEELAR